MDIAISIITLGNGADAVIRMIKAISFDATTGAMFDKFQRVIDIDSCLKAGMQVDGRSLLAWKDSGEEPTPVHLNEALLDLRDAFIWEETRIWTDITLHAAAVLDTAYRKSNLSVPWEFYNLRDAGSITGEQGLIVLKWRMV